MAHFAPLSRAGNPKPLKREDKIILPAKNNELQQLFGETRIEVLEEVDGHFASDAAHEFDAGLGENAVEDRLDIVAGFRASGNRHEVNAACRACRPRRFSRSKACGFLAASRRECERGSNSGGEIRPRAA